MVVGGMVAAVVGGGGGWWSRVILVLSFKPSLTTRTTRTRMYQKGYFGMSVIRHIDSTHLMEDRL